MTVNNRSDPPAHLLRNLTGSDHSSLPLLMRSRAEKTPDRTFLIEGGRRWTYAEALEEMRRFAAFLRASGIREGDRVASYLTNRPECLWSWFGTMAAGAIYVPLNRHHKGSLLADLLARSQARMLVTETAAIDELEHIKQGRDLRLLVADSDSRPLPDGFEDYPHSYPDDGFWTEGEPGDLATILFTSGTTGRSKAVRLPHNMFCRGGDALTAAYGFNSDDVFHAWLPLFHIAGLLHCATTMIVASGAIALFPTFSRSQFWSQVSDTRATVLTGLPNVLTMLLEAPATDKDDASTLRLGVIAAVPAHLQKEFEERFGVRLLNTYGMSEIEPLTIPIAAEATPIGSCGRAGRDFELFIVDEHDQRLGPREPGEIVARPKVPWVMTLGYEDDDRATVEAWRNMLFHTGDIGYVDEDGYVFVQGRIKHMIRRGGENISTWELETLIAEHPKIEEAVVVGIPTQSGDEEVKAVLVLAPGSTLMESEIHDYCQSRFARFMVPRYIEIRDEMPLSDIGKVQKELLKNTGPPVWDCRKG